jgi:hypothetical protein
MKNNLSLFILTLISLSFGTFAQDKGTLSIIPEKTQPKSTLPNSSFSKDSTIVSYHVEERVGKNITLYNVSYFSLIETSDLGPNNIRIITPKYAKNKTTTRRLIPADTISVKIATTALTPVKNPLDLEVNTPEKKPTFIIIDVISTYERILEKGGYESIDMLKKVANNRYFKGDFAVARKWYSQLFAQTKNLEIEYYYRYAQTLFSEGRTEKGKEMMKTFETIRMSK